MQLGGPRADQATPELRVASTAAAAQIAAEEKGTAAIASRIAAEQYGLEIVARSIQDQAGNVTRFIVVGDASKSRPTLRSASLRKPTT